MYDGFVDHGLTLDDFGVAMQLDIEHDAIAAGESSFQYVFQGGIHFFQLKTGEKAEAAHVDGKNGDTERRGNARCGEQGAIAAEDQQELRFFRDFEAIASLGQIGQSVGGFQVVQSANPAGLEPAQQGGHNAFQVGTPRAGDYADGVE